MMNKKKKKIAADIVDVGTEGGGGLLEWLCLHASPMCGHWLVNVCVHVHKMYM